MFHLNPLPSRGFILEISSLIFSGEKKFKKNIQDCQLQLVVTDTLRIQVNGYTFKGSNSAIFMFASLFRSALKHVTGKKSLKRIIVNSYREEFAPQGGN